MSDANKALVLRWFDELFNGRNLEVCDEIIATRYIEHAIEPFGRTEPGEVDGPEHMRAVARWLLDQFPDIQMVVEAIVGEGDLVAARVRSHGTNLGKLGGVMPPTSKAFSAEQTHWFRISGERLAEHWATRDDLTAMMQLGVVGPPGPTA